MKTIGIIGGMGPLATVDLMKKIIDKTPAEKDQDHIHIIADDYPRIPDRTAAILGEGEDPAPFMIESAKRLETAGADILAMACNTAHYFYDKIQQSVGIPIIHMPKEVAKYAYDKQIKKVGLIATIGTITTNLYQQNLENLGIECLLPDEENQKLVMEGIYAIKAGDLEKGRELLSSVAKKLSDLGAEGVIAGCTEVPLVLSTTEELLVIDSTDVVAQKLVENCLEPEVVTQ